MGRKNNQRAGVQGGRERHWNKKKGRCGLQAGIEKVWQRTPAPDADIVMVSGGVGPSKPS